MGQLLSSPEPPSPPQPASPQPASPPPAPPAPKVFIPPLFDFPSLATRTSSFESEYNVAFGKMALRDLFNNYFEGVNRFSTKMIMLDLDPDSFASFIFDVAGPLDRNSEEGIAGNAEFRLSSTAYGNEVKLDVCVSSTEPTLLMRSSTYFPKYGVGAFWKTGPLLERERAFAGNDGIIGWVCDSSVCSTGATVTINDWDNRVFPQTAWFVVKIIEEVTAGVYYEPKFKSRGIAPYKNLKNWSCAISYGRDIDNQSTPSFNFGLQLANNSQFIASFYQHMVVQRRVMNPFEKKEYVQISNYIDYGVELQTTTMEAYKNKTFQFAASWQANENILLKAKVGPLSSSIALVFKSWWKPALKFNVLAVRDHAKGGTSFGLGFQVESNQQKRYETPLPRNVSYPPHRYVLVGSGRTQTPYDTFDG